MAEEDEKNVNTNDTEKLKTLSPVKGEPNQTRPSAQDLQKLMEEKAREVEIQKQNLQEALENERVSTPEELEKLIQNKATPEEIRKNLKKDLEEGTVPVDFPKLYK